MEWVVAHTIHLVPLLGLGGWFGWNWLARTRARNRAAGAGGGRRPGPAVVPASVEARLVLMACSVGAAVVHADVIGGHFRASALYGWFFVLSALAQLAWGLLIVRRADQALLVWGAVGNALVVMLWLVTRTAGLPVGPQPWRAEGVGAFDLLATMLEVALVAGALGLLAGASRARRSRLKI